MDVEGKFEGMARIMRNDKHFNLILKMCIGNGDSITKSAEVHEEPKEERIKESKERK